MNMIWKKILWVFMVTCVLISVLLFGYSAGNQYSLHTPGQIVPAAITLPKDRQLLHDKGEEQLLAKVLQAMQRRIDSLAADSAGRRIYDSIVEMRPGLLDSLKVVTRYFIH